MDVAFGERPVTFDKLKQAFKHVGMILDDGRNQLRRLLPRMAANEVSINPSLDQGLCNPAIEFVNALDLSGFNRPFPCKPLTELSESAALLHVGPLVIPELK